MIEDIEGATTESPRRLHVFAASLATASVAAALFLALVLSPLELDDLPRAPVPSASPIAGPLVIAAPTLSILGNIEQSRQRACAWGPGLQWIFVPTPTAEGVTLRPLTVAVAIDRGTGRLIPVADRIDQTTLWMTVTCDTSNASAPRVDLKTTPR